MLVLLLLLISRLINGSGLRIPILKFSALVDETDAAKDYERGSVGDLFSSIDFT